MAKKRLINLRFPVAGLDRRWAYQGQPPFSTPDALNVQPKDTAEGRTRGGSRPGLRKWAHEQLGSGHPIRMLAGLHVVKNNGLTFWSDEFEGQSMGDVWSIPSWIGVFPNIFGDDGALTYGDEVGAVRAALDSIDTSQNYVIELLATPYSGAHNGTFKIFARMDDSTPSAVTDGIIVELTMTGETGDFDGSLKSYVGGTLTEYPFTGAGSDGYPVTGWFKVLVSGNNIKAYWNGTLLIDQNVSAHTGKRVGFGMQCTIDGGACVAASFRAQYYASDGREVTRKFLLASSNGLLYTDTFMNQMAQVSSALTLASDRHIQATEHLQKLYIADRGNPKARAADGVITSGVLDSATYASWNAVGINVNDYVAVIDDVQGGTGSFADDIGGTFKITSIHDTNGLTLTGATGNCSSCSFRLERGPKVYDPAAGTLSIWTDTTGVQGSAVPTGCRIVALYRDRLVMAGDPQAPHVLYLSRQGDGHDWNFGADSDDVGRAMPLQTTEAGRPGEPITAVIPYIEDYLIIGATNSIWIMRGDPAYGASKLMRLTDKAGIVSEGAWCSGPQGEFYILSTDGLYVIPPGGGPPQSLSKEKLPRELINLSASLYTVSMAYSASGRGVHLFLSGQEARQERHWWFDLDTKSFWPWALQSEHEPMSLDVYASPNATESAVLLGGRDGYIRRFDDLAERDESHEIESHVVYGPVRLGGDDYHVGMLMELIGVTSKKSGEVDWEVLVGETHEDALGPNVFASGTWDRAGLNFKARPRARGGSFFLRLSNGLAKRAWSVESITAVVAQRGKQRLA